MQREMRYHFRASADSVVLLVRAGVDNQTVCYTLVQFDLSKRIGFAPLQNFFVNFFVRKNFGTELAYTTARGTDTRFWSRE